MRVSRGPTRGVRRKHDPVPLGVVQDRVNGLLEQRKVTTVDGFVELPEDVSEVSICCHSDTPVSTIAVRSIGNTCPAERADGDLLGSS